MCICIHCFSIIVGFSYYVVFFLNVNNDMVNFVKCGSDVCFMWVFTKLIRTVIWTKKPRS